MVFRLLAPWLAAVLAFSHPSAAGDSGAGAPEDKFTGEVVIGATLPLTGKFDYYGQSAYYGALTRARLINEKGGVAGKRLVIEWRDNGSDTGQATRDIEELVSKFQVLAVIGPLLSDSVIAAIPTAKRLRIPLISPLASADIVTVDNAWVFRVCYGNSPQAAALANFQIEKYGAKTCGIIYDSNYFFSAEFPSVFQGKFAALGGKVVAIASFRDENGEKDYEKALRFVAAKNPDFIFAPSYALEATELIHASKELGISTRFCGPETWDNELLFEGAGTRLAGTCFTSVIYEEALRYRPFQEFMREIQNAGMDEPDAQAASAYDAVSLLALAAEKADSPAALRDRLAGFRNLNLATGRMSVDKELNIVKPVLIRVVERKGNRMMPVYAERYDP
ncbi:MAG: ABC transporter substrate-binding protein [Planctomycetota bacterium]|jgi:branched-chain amino acid transport system substrate-binding protein|nr:ABC transporter substrate-binding protein [Planctomycetota bacterium]